MLCRRLSELCSIMKLWDAIASSCDDPVNVRFDKLLGTEIFMDFLADVNCEIMRDWKIMFHPFLY